MFKKLFSYIIPITIFKQKSSLSQSLEVTWANGELVLDSKNTNYSYGSLQRILRKGLEIIGSDKINSMQHVLVLGVAGGSVIKTLVEEIQYKGNITGVEIDAEIITIANTYFKLDKIPNLEIVIEDAAKFIFKTPNTYNLIVIDIFQDAAMPNFLFEKPFINQLELILEKKGIILFNTMIANENQNERNKKYLSEFNPNYFKAIKTPRIEYHNELILIEKI